MIDRLDEIRALLAPSRGRADTDMRWLVSEVERLRDDKVAIATRHLEAEADLTALHADLQSMLINIAEFSRGKATLTDEASTVVYPLLQRHAEAVEKAWKEGYYQARCEDGQLPDMALMDAAWLASEAKARLT